MNKLLLLSFLSGISFFCSAQAPGFLKELSPDSGIILPPPPPIKSKAFLSDVDSYEEGIKSKGSMRWNQAVSDADMSLENLEEIFSRPLSKKISSTSTPAVSKIIDLIRYDAGFYSTKSAKLKYKRERPFTYFKHHSCTPDKDKELAMNGSYPSGHAAAGWAIALVLAEIKPSNKEEIIKQGYEYGQSRVICGVHWQSDVIAGRLMGAVLVSTLHSNKEFEEALEKAKKEVENEM
ncbi:phosphatase PAP2 family protein [Nissabacter archeti]|uniref:Acid phosphatase n=1 Tax=Nissabacter archeti TaxID=1917880 RepID=A0ABS5JG68_9GAMM|nr:phosphatase PAP2 family protein [Nissabacter archeti]MBS0968333.1 phosphatase PAP2 family protein [Nissabacter archeti]